MNPIPEKHAWRHRLAALGAYCGLLPILAFAPIRRKSTFVDRHYRQAAVLYFALFLLFLLFVFGVIVLSYLMIYHRPFYDRSHPEPHLIRFCRRLLIVWAVFWGYGMVQALRGSPHDMPLVARLAKRLRLVHAAVILLTSSMLLSALLAAFAVHASRLTRQDTHPGKAYILYEDIDTFPRWIFAVGFYPLSRAAADRWGPDSMVMLRLSKESLQRAVREARFLFIGSHGQAHGLLLKSGYIKPEMLREMGPGEGLQFVYLTSCDSGAQKQAWEAAFAPATVVTYDRLTAVIEHLWWICFDGPRLLRNLPDPA